MEATSGVVSVLAGGSEVSLVHMHNHLCFEWWFLSAPVESGRGPDAKGGVL